MRDDVGCVALPSRASPSPRRAHRAGGGLRGVRAALRTGARSVAAARRPVPYAARGDRDRAHHLAGAGGSGAGRTGARHLPDIAGRGLRPGGRAMVRSGLRHRLAGRVDRDDVGKSDAVRRAGARRWALPAGAVRGAGLDRRGAPAGVGPRSGDLCRRSPRDCQRPRLRQPGDGGRHLHAGRAVRRPLGGASARWAGWDHVGGSGCDPAHGCTRHRRRHLRTGRAGLVVRPGRTGMVPGRRQRDLPVEP